MSVPKIKSIFCLKKKKLSTFKKSLKKKIILSSKLLVNYYHCIVFTTKCIYFFLNVNKDWKIKFSIQISTVNFKFTWILEKKFNLKTRIQKYFVTLQIIFSYKYLSSRGNWNSLDLLIYLGLKFFSIVKIGILLLNIFC